MDNSFNNILFIELLGGIGDLVIALPAIHAVARTHSNARMTVLTFQSGAQLLDSDPDIDCVICAVPGQAKQTVAQTLATESFDLIISDTNYDGIADLIQAVAPQRAITNLWRTPPDHEYVGERFLKILQQEGVVTEVGAEVGTEASPSQPEIHLTAAEQAAARQQLGATYRPLVVLCPEAGMEIKRWSAANFVALGRALQQDGATVLIPAGQTELAMQIAAEITAELTAELAATEPISSEANATVQVWPQGSLRHLAAAIANADLVVAADTGLAHIAAALQVPTLTLFGPSWAGRYGHAAPHINLQGWPDCPERVISNFTKQQCWYGNCPFEWRTCLEAISVEAVLAAARSLLVVKRSETSSLKKLDQLSQNLPQASQPEWQSVRNLLVLRLDNIGDVIMTSPLLEALKANLPQAKLTLMASPAGSLAAPLLPWIDEVLVWRTLWQDLGRLAFDPEREWQLIETLRARQFDAAIILTSFSQSPHPAGLICALAGIPLRLGESTETDFYTLTHAASATPNYIHQVERNLHLVESIGFKVDNRHLSINIPNHTSTPAPYLLLNPWTSCQSRNYPSEHWAEAARQLSDQTGWPVVVTGVEQDRERAQSLLAILGERAIDRVGQTSLSELAALIAQAKLVLTNNTSVMHLADATQTPMVVAFAGTEQESQWYPRHSRNHLLRRPTVCSPCYSLTCPYQLQCLEISVETIVQSALELLQVAAISEVSRCG